MLEHFSSRGVDIAFIDVRPRGHDLGEPILLIHGFASNHRVNWVDPRWVETLTQAGRRVVAFDNRGHGQSEKLYAPADYRAELMTAGRGQPARAFGDRARRRDGLFDGRADRELSRARRAEARARADPRRARRPAHARRRVAGGDRRGDGGAVARRPRRSDAAHVPRLRRADEERPRRARRLRPRLAAEADAGGSRRASPSRRWSRSGERDTVAGDPHKLAAMLPQAERRSTFPAAITISRSATARSRRRRSIFSPAGNEPLRGAAID